MKGFISFNHIYRLGDHYTNGSLIDGDPLREKGYLILHNKNSMKDIKFEVLEINPNFDGVFIEFNPNKERHKYFSNLIKYNIGGK